MPKTIAVAFAGSGEVKEEAVHALLNDWLGFGPWDADGFYLPSDDDVVVILPVSEKHLTSGVGAVLDWTAVADLPYTAVTDWPPDDTGVPNDVRPILQDSDNRIDTTNVNKALIDTLLDVNADERYLVLLWGEEGDDNAEALLTLADLKGIPVKDLTAGLDDISFAEEEPDEAPPPPPKPSRAKKEPEPVAEDLAKEEPPGLETAEASTSIEAIGSGPLFKDLTAGLDDMEEAINTPDEEHDPRRTLYSVYDFLLCADITANARNLIRITDERFVRSPLTVLVWETLNAVGGPEGTERPPEAPQAPPPTPSEGEAPVAPKRGRGRPRQTALEDVTTGFIRDVDGYHRRASRGRPRRGETRVELTEAQVAALDAEGMLVPDLDSSE